MTHKIIGLESSKTYVSGTKEYCLRWLQKAFPYPANTYEGTDVVRNSGMRDWKLPEAMKVIRR